MSAGLQITGWPAHDSAISSILFGPDETSIFSLGVDGKASALRSFSQLCILKCCPHHYLNCRWPYSFVILKVFT